MPEEKSKQTKSEIPSSKQSKEKKRTLADYLEEKMKEIGMKSQRKKLPKDKVRVFFKR
jgi:vesicle coat complex subunit